MCAVLKERARFKEDRCSRQRALYLATTLFTCALQLRCPKLWARMRNMSFLLLI